MRKNKTFSLQRIISLFLVLAMLLSGIAQSGFSFGHKEVQAQSDSPTITTSISTHHGAVMQDGTEPGDTDPAETEPPIIDPIKTEPPVVTDPAETETPIIDPIETESPVITPTETPDDPDPIITTPDPSTTPEPSVTPEPSPTLPPSMDETKEPTSQPEPTGTDGIFNWIDISIDGFDGVEITAYLGTDTNLTIPNELTEPDNTTKPVLSIGAHALQGKQLTFITLPEGLIRIGDYAFADNQLASITTPEPPQHIILPSTLKYIGEFAFRDNKLTVLDIPLSVISLDRGAFISNNLYSLTLHESLEVIGNSVFELNQLVEVWMPNSITTMGTDVFAQNGRYVKVVTENPIIQTEYSPKGFGHVVNPITIIVKHHDPDGNMLISDKILGEDLSIPGEAFSVGLPVTYTPQEITGYMTESPITFTPDCDGYVVTLIYYPTNIPPVITKTPIHIEPGTDSDGIEALLQEGLTATDFQGNDITSDVTWVHDIDSAVPGVYTVTYSVTDQWGNTTVKQVAALVGNNWYQYPICIGWVLGDFTYDDSGTVILGLSEQGLSKYSAGQNSVCLPGFSPNTLENITRIGANAFKDQVFTAVDFSRVTELIQINQNSFTNSQLTNLDLSRNTKLEIIATSAFQNSLLQTLDLSANTSLSLIGNYAFQKSPLQALDLSANPSLNIIGDYAFQESLLQALDLSANTSLSIIGDNTFEKSPLRTLNLSGNPNLSKIGKWAFFYNRLETIDLSQLSALTYLGQSSFFGVYNDPPQANLIMPSTCNLLMIDNGAFANKRFSSLDFSNCAQLNHIGGFTFSAANATSIRFAPNSAITLIGTNAFINSPLTELDLDSLPNLQVIENSAFRSSMLTELDFSKTPKLTSIGSSAFEKSPIRSLNFSNNLELMFLSEKVFYNAQITNLDLSGAPNLTHLGAEVFYNAPLRSLTLPADIRGIRPKAFYNHQLTHLDLSNATSLMYIGAEAFYGGPSFESINIGNNCAITYINKAAFGGARFSSLDLSSCKSLNYIGESAFENSPLQILQLDNPALTTIDSFAFSNGSVDNFDMTKVPNLGCIGDSGLKAVSDNSLDFSQNTALQYIGKQAFYNAPLFTLDLTNNPNIKYLGSEAFKASSVDEVWISPVANFTVPRSNETTRSTELYTGLYNGDTAIFRTPSGESTMPSDPNGDLIKSGNVRCPVSGNFDFVYHNAFTMSRAINVWPWSEQYTRNRRTGDNRGIHPIYRYYGWSNVRGGKYIVNPQILTIYSKDTNGNDIAEPYTINTPGTGVFTIKPRLIYGYCTPSDQTVTLPLADPSITFTYEDISHCHPGDTTGIHLFQAYNTPIKPGPYLIGDQMISRVLLDMSGYNATINTPKIVVFYDPSVYDESQISVPTGPVGDSSVIGSTAENGMLTIYLTSMSGGDNIDIPISWKFRKYVTPEYTPFPLEALFLNDGGHPLAEANPVDFQGYYPDPDMRKYVDDKYEDGVILRHFTPSRYGDPAIDEVDTEYVDFTFSVHNLERNVGTFTITDTLPVYPSMENGVQSQRTAIFDQTANPSWVLSADGTTITYTGNAYGSRNISIPRLRLRFPWAMYYYNIQNTVSGVLTPFNKSPFEDNMYVADSIIFSFGEKLEIPGIFAKDIFGPHYQADKAYFYDTSHDRHLNMPWELLINPDVDLYNIVLSDFNLDERLYYSSVIVPQIFYGGTYHLIDANGITIETGYITSRYFYWSQEIGLQTKRVEFHLGFLPSGFHQVTLNTRLVNPDNEHFDDTPGSTNNVFWNTGALSYALNPEDEPSHYIEDDEELYIRQTRMAVRPRKTQEIKDKPDDDIAFPGDTVIYEIFVNDQTYETYHDVLNDFIMIDLMPNGINVISVMPHFRFRDCGGSYEIINNYNGTGRTAVVFSSPILINQGFPNNPIAKIYAGVDPFALDGDYLNEVFLDFSNTNVENLGERVGDHLQDPNETKYSRATTSLSVTSVREVRSFKAIRRLNTDPWNYFGIETPAGEPFQYSLNVLNNTVKQRTDMVLVDVFPYINDTAITENLEGVRLPRGSQFANTFNLEEAVNVSILISGPGNTPYTPAHTVRYYNSDTAIDYGTGSTEDVLDGLPWSDSPATNTIAIRIELGEDLPANSLLRVIVPMKAPSNDNLSLSNLRAYNTFVRKDDSTRDLGGVSRYLEPNRIYNHIPMPTVDITLTKVGENPDEYLEGAVFELRDSAGVLVKRASTNPNGVINFPDVEIGDYTLTEVQAPTGYKLLPDSLIITEQMMIDAYNTGIALAIGPIVNEPVGPPAIIGSVIIEKLDANHVPLADFEFTIEGKTPADPPEQPGNTHIKMVGKSNAEGKIIFSNLPKGSYEITESGSVAPFLPVAPFNATIETQGQVIKFTLDNDPPNPIINDKVGLRVNKLGVFPESLCATAPYNPPSNCTYQSGTPLPSAQFSIFAANGDDLVDGPLTTNEQGYVDFPSEGHPGLDVNTRYILREVSGVEGYTPYTDDIPFMFNERGELYYCESDTSCTRPFELGQIYVPNIRIPQTGQVTVFKMDAFPPPLPLESAEFTIYRQLDPEGWEVVEVLTTDATGSAVSSILPAGVYKIKETKAPVGYFISPLEETFIINPYPLPGEPTFLEFSYVFFNFRLNMALIKYEMMHRNVTYAEAVDLLAAMAETCPNCKIFTTDFYEVIFPIPADTIVHVIKPLDMANFALLDENKTQLETGLTTDGWLIFDYNNIDETKTYYLRELTPPAGYRPVLGDFPVRIADYTSRPGFDGRIIVPVENKLQLGQISVSKYNLPHKTGMSGVTFELTGPSDNPGHPSQVRTGTTDAFGYISWQNLPFGSYTLKEIATPEGYVLDPTVHEITITADNPHRYIVVYNKNIRDIKITKVELNSDPPKFLQGAVFALYLPGETEPLGTSITDADGFATFKDVVYGDYILKEIKAPPGYRLNNVEIPVTVDDFLKPIITYTVKDAPIDEDLPDTGTLGALAYLLAGMVLLAAGFWFSKRWAKTHR